MESEQKPYPFVWEENAAPRVDYSTVLEDSHKFTDSFRSKIHFNAVCLYLRPTQPVASHGITRKASPRKDFNDPGIR
jgi:hypothetical protein